jgi:hypothetical protein
MYMSVICCDMLYVCYMLCVCHMSSPRGGSYYLCAFVQSHTTVKWWWNLGTALYTILYTVRGVGSGSRDVDA